MECELTLIPLPDDPPLEIPARMRWRPSTPNAIGDELARGRTSPDETLYLPDFPTLTEATKLASIVGPLVGTVVGAWLHARYGRKVRLKVGEVEAEAQTVEEVEKLFERAEEIQRINDNKMVEELRQLIQREREIPRSNELKIIIHEP